MAEPRVLSPSMRRAQRLLVAGLLGGHVAALLASLFFFLWRGPASGFSALIAAVIALAFYTIGQAVQVAMADASPQRVLTASLASYAIRVSALAGLLILTTQAESRLAGVDRVAVVVGTLSVVTGWLAAEIWTFARMRVPIFDSTEDEADPEGVAVQPGDPSC